MFICISEQSRVSPGHFSGLLNDLLNDKALCVSEDRKEGFMSVLPLSHIQTGCYQIYFNRTFPPGEAGDGPSEHGATRHTSDSFSVTVILSLMFYWNL